MATQSNMRKSGPAADIIPPHAYPPPLRKAQARAFVESLMSDAVLERTEKVLDAHKDNLRSAVLSHLGCLEEDLEGGDFRAVYEQAHEIRGLAGTAGLKYTGRIAFGLCNYLEAMTRSGGTPDAAVIELHVDAIARAARSGEDFQALGEEVTSQLSALVRRRIGEPAKARS